MLLIEICLNMVDEGPAVLRAVMGMHGNPRPLIHQEDVVIFINDVQPGRSHGQIGVVLTWLVEKLVIDIQLKHISGFQPGIPLRTGSIALDPFDAEGLLCQGRRKQRHRLCQKSVQPLSGIVGTDG